MGTKIKILLFILCIFGLYVFIEETSIEESVPPPKDTTTPLTTKNTGITNTTNSKHSDITPSFDDIMGLFDEENKVATIASTENENLTEKDIVEFFVTELLKFISFLYSSNLCYIR